MAHVTAIVSDAQVEYRVGQAHGCGPDPAVDYRVQGMGGAQLWLGAGLADVGLLAGQEFIPEAGRALLAGVHPGTGEALVPPVLRLPETAKLPAVALVDAVILAGAEPTGTGNGRAVRGVDAVGGPDWVARGRLHRRCAAAGPGRRPGRAGPG